MLMNRFGNSRRGVVLVVVLVLFMAMSGLTLATIDISSRGAVESARVRSEYQAHFMAEEALNIVYRLIEQDEEFFSDTPLEKWADPWEADGVRIIISPCNAKLNLNRLAQESNQKAVKVMQSVLPAGVDTKRLLGSLGNWVGKKVSKRLQKFDNMYYASHYPPYTSPEGELDSPEEVLLVNGWGGFDREWIRDTFTVWGTGGKLNINFVPREILLAFFPKLQRRMKSIIHWRDTRGFTDLSQLVSVAGIQADSNLYRDLLNKFSVRSKYYEATVVATAQDCTVVKRYIVSKPGEFDNTLPSLISQSDLSVTFSE